MTRSDRPGGVIDDAASVTAILKAAMSGTRNPRLKEIVDALFEHGHAFLKQVRLTDAEFKQRLAFLRVIGQACNDWHNEVVLLADVLGFSTLVALLNYADASGRTLGALLGPFYRGGKPEYESGQCIACEVAMRRFDSCRLAPSEPRALHKRADRPAMPLLAMSLLQAGPR
jgi:hypothetical protein